MGHEPTSSNVNVRRTATRVAHCCASLPADLADAIFDEPERLLTGGQLLRVNGARRTVLVEWRDARFVLKHYIEPTRRHALKQLVQRSRAHTSWLFSHRLADAGIATPRPVAFVENRWGRLRRDSFLVYPYVEGRTLGECLSKEPANLLETRRLWRQLEELWARLRALSVGLADANVGNFIVTPQRQLWCIDLDKSRFHRFDYLARRRQARAWAQLVRSATRHIADPALSIIVNSGSRDVPATSDAWKKSHKAA